MSRDVKRVMNGLRRYADPPSSFEVRSNKHYRVSWEMTTVDGDKVNVQTTLSMSPKGNYWMDNHKRQLEQKFRELNISTEVTHI